MSREKTILDYLNEDCWRLVLGYVPFQDIIRTECVSRQWQQVVLSYMSHVHIGIRTEYLGKAGKKADIVNNVPNISWLTVEQYYKPSFESWLHKLGASVVACYCSKWNFNLMGKNCPNLEAAVFLKIPERKLLNNRYDNFQHLKQLCFIHCHSMTDDSLNQYITSPVLEELSILYNDRATGQCFKNLTSENLKSLDFRYCKAMSCRHLAAASNHFRMVTKLVLEYINGEEADEFDEEELNYILLLLEKTTNLRHFITYGFGQEVDELFESVCRLSCLERLVIDTPGTDEALEAVLWRCPKLRILKFKNCLAVTGRGLAAATAHAGARLVALHVPGSHHLKDDDVVACILACPNLEELDLGACLQVTRALLPRAAAARRAVRARRPLRLQVTRALLPRAPAVRRAVRARRPLRLQVTRALLPRAAAACRAVRAAAPRGGRAPGRARAPPAAPAQRAQGPDPPRDL